MTTSKQQGGAIAAVAGAVIVASLVWIVNNYDNNAQKKKKKDDDSMFGVPAELMKNEKAIHLAELKLAIQLALQAGQNMLPHTETKGTAEEKTEAELGISTKGGKAEDFATAIDLQNEALIIDAIQANFPTHDIIGEESSSASGQIKPLSKTTPTWIIDPVDGTTNFASGLPLACVSIGFCNDKGEPQVGVVYSPQTNELYVGHRGCGSYRNGVRITGAKDKKKLASAIVDFEFGYARSQPAVHRMVTAVQNVMSHGCRSMRCLGSGVLDICFVATGRLDVVYAGVADEGWKPWDYCAGLVIALEAGCAMEALVDQPPDAGFDLYSKSIICATSKSLLDEAREVVLKGL